jgi:hypothetical protein
MKGNGATENERGIAKFCEDLYAPLDRANNLIFIARHTETDPEHAEQFLEAAERNIAEVRGKVLEHCKAPKKQTED